MRPTTKKERKELKKLIASQKWVMYQPSTDYLYLTNDPRIPAKLAMFFVLIGEL